MGLASNKRGVTLDADIFFNEPMGQQIFNCLISTKSVISKFKYRLKPMINHVIQPYSFPNLNNLRFCFWGGNFSDLMEIAKKRKTFLVNFLHKSCNSNCRVCFIFIRVCFKYIERTEGVKLSKADNSSSTKYSTNVT